MTARQSDASLAALLPVKRRCAPALGDRADPPRLGRCRQAARGSPLGPLHPASATTTSTGSSRPGRPGGLEGRR